MPLHRDIHWIGRQWAVTGHGVQLIDQKLQGFFDIEASKLWNDALIDSMYAKDWLNIADFEKALAVARARYPRQESAQPPANVVTPRREAASPPPVEPVVAPPSPPPLPVAESDLAEAPKPEPPTPSHSMFEMQCAGRARFVRPWRVVVRKI